MIYARACMKLWNRNTRAVCLHVRLRKSSQLTSPSSCDSSRFLFRFLSRFSFAFLSFSFWYSVLRLCLFLMSENTISFLSVSAIFDYCTWAQSFTFKIDSFLVPRAAQFYNNGAREVGLPQAITSCLCYTLPIVVDMSTVVSLGSIASGLL